MESLRDGDIALIRARWWLHPLTEYDHAALVWTWQPRLQGEAQYWYSLEAGFSGVRAYRLAHWPRPFVILRPVCELRVSYDALTQAMRWLGDPYAWWHLPAVFRRIMERKRGKQNINTLSEARVCTELVVDAYRAVGLDLCPGIERPTPDDIADSKRVEHVGRGGDAACRI